MVKDSYPKCRLTRLPSHSKPLEGFTYTPRAALKAREAGPKRAPHPLDLVTWVDENDAWRVPALGCLRGPLRQL